MNIERSAEQARSVWQGQAVQGRQFSTEEITTMSERFNSLIQRRNRREYVGGALGIAGSAWFAWHGKDLGTRAGFALLILGTLYVGWQLARRGTPRPEPADAAAQSCLVYHRTELEQQYELLRSVWSWYLAPLVPGFVVLYASRAWLAAQRGPGALLAVALGACVTGLVFWGVLWLNRRGASKLRAELRALDAAQGS